MILDYIDRRAEAAVLHAFQRLRHGGLRLETPAGVRRFGRDEGAAILRVHQPRFFRRAVAGAEMGLGESYMDGDWSTPDLVGLVRLMLANQALFGALPALPAWLSARAAAIGHRWRDNTRRGSRRNIAHHYDLGNRFFELFLDDSLMYSSAVFADRDDALEAAQQHKLRLVCDKLDLRPGDRVLEIGSGWGGFARFAAGRYGCHVTTTTISAEQHEYVSDLIARSGEVGARIDLRFEDYRELRGRFDKIVSIEMFEAVGLRHYDEFFAACDRLLDRDGLMLLQTITVDDWRSREYLRSPSWIARHVFPGAELASVAEILASMARVTRLTLHHAAQIGTHYARTLHEWRRRFHRRIDDVRAQGFDERFIRMWDLYLGYCEAAFLERHIGDVQLLLARSANRRVLFGEPWQAPAAAGGSLTAARS
jgi:cyclopropane-fatty-acyl-phospholipid synthase